MWAKRPDHPAQTESWATHILLSSEPSPSAAECAASTKNTSASGHFEHFCLQLSQCGYCQVHVGFMFTQGPTYLPLCHWRGEKFNSEYANRPLCCALKLQMSEYSHILPSVCNIETIWIDIWRSGSCWTFFCGHFFPPIWPFLRSWNLKVRTTYSICLIRANRSSVYTVPEVVLFSLHSNSHYIFIFSLQFHIPHMIKNESCSVSICWCATTIVNW